MTVVTRFASAGESVIATLITKDMYNNSKPYTDEEALVTAKVIAYAPATNWYGMVSVNHNDGSTTLTSVPEISSSYSLVVYFNGIMATEARAGTRCGHVAATAVCVSPGVPAANLDLAEVGRSRYASPAQTNAGTFPVEITPVDSYGNEHTGPDESCPGSGNCFSCLAYNVNDPQTYISDVDAAYNYADLNGHYIATMSLQQTGNFRVLCYLADSSGQKFPLTAAPLPIQVEPGPISSQQTRVTGEGLIRAVAGQEQVMTVTTRDQYGNEVTSGNAVFSGTLRGPLMVPIAFARIDGGQFTATYTATASGDYVVSIMRGGGEPIDASPWGPPNGGLTVAPAVVEAAMCTFVDAMCPAAVDATDIYTDICLRNLPGRPATAEAGQNFTFAVVSRDHYTNILVNGGDFILATAQRSDSFRLISGQTTDNVDGTYTIQFSIFQTGQYSMRTVVSALDIDNSPFDLTITPAVVVPGMTCGTGLDGSGNPCVVNTNRNGCEQLTGTCRYVPGSVVSGTGRLYAIAGTSAPLSILAYDRFNNPSGNLGQAGSFIEVSVKRGATVDVVSYVQSAISVGVFECPFTTEVSTANALLEVTLGGAHFEGSPETIVVHSNMPVKAMSIVERAPTGAVASDPALAGSTTQFVVTPKDEWQNGIDWSDAGWLSAHSNPVIETTLNIRCRQLVQDGPVMTELQCNQASIAATAANTYTISTQATVAGVYDVIVSIGGDIQGSPTGMIIVHAALEPANCQAVGQGLIGGQHQSVAQWTFTAQDTYGNPIDAAESDSTFQIMTRPRDSVGTLLGSESADANALPVPIRNGYETDALSVGIGVVHFAYRYNAAGAYTVEIKIRINGVETNIAGSPFALTVLSQEGVTDPTQSIPYGPGLRGSIAGLEGEFFVQARDALGIDRSQGGHGFFVADADGNYYSTGAPPCAADATKQCDGIEVTMVDANQASDIEFFAVQNIDGTFTIKYNSTAAGTYSINMQMCIGTVGCLAMPQNLIAQMPVAIIVVAAAAMAEQTEFSLDTCIAGQSCMVPCTPRDAFGNAALYDPATGPAIVGFSAQPTGGSALVGTIADKLDGTVDLVFNPTEATQFGLRLTWHAQMTPTDFRDIAVHQLNVLPFVTSTQNCVATGTGLTEVAMAGVDGEFTIIAKDRYDNLIRGGGDVFALEYAGAQSLSVLDNADGTYIAKYIITAVGVHSLIVARAGYDIAGSPLSIQIEANAAYPQHCVVDALPLGSVTPLIVSTFSVTTYDVYHNLREVGDEVVTVSVRVHPLPLAVGAPPPPPYEEVQGNSLYVSAGVHSASYSISTAIVTAGGNCFVDITLNNATLPNSPFTPHLQLASPPVAQTSQFSSMARTILVQFDQDTDRAGTFEPVECEYYFTVVSAATLGEGKECLWQGDKDLLIVLGADASVTVDETLMLTSAASSPSIRTKLGNSRATSGGITVAAPANPVTPAVTISAADSYANCDEIILDASGTSGGAGRAMTYTWGLEPNVPDFTSLSAMMRQQTGTVVNIEPYNLTAGTDYVFHLRATNFFGETAASSVRLSISALPLPQISVGDGNTIVHTTKDQELYLNARVVLSNCMPPELSQMTYLWSATDWSGAVPIEDELTLDPRTLATRMLVISKDTLKPGEWYDLHLYGHSTNNASYAGSATVRVVCDYTPVQAVISGGDRIVSRLGQIELSAAASIDPDNLDAPFTYTWACYRTTDVSFQPLATTGQCFSDVTGLLVASIPVLRLPSGLLNPGEHVFTVTVAKEKGVGNVELSSTSVVLTVKAESVPIVSIAAGNINPKKINPSAKIVLRSLVEEVVSAEYTGLRHDVEWSCVSGGFNTSDPSLRASSMTNPALVLLPSVLSPGQTYRFRLSANSLMPDGGLGAATIELAVNLKPSGGRFAIEPSTGRFETLFELRASGWIDEDVPLKFEFRRVATSVTNEGVGKIEQIPVGSLAPSTLNVVTSSLPEGDADTEACVEIATGSSSVAADNAACFDADLTGDATASAAACAAVRTAANFGTLACDYTPAYQFGMVMRAYDAFGAFAEARTNVVVEPTPAMTESAFVGAGSLMLERSIRSGNLAGVLTITDTMTKNLNPAKENRRRLEEHYSHPGNEGSLADPQHRMLQTSDLVELRMGMMQTVEAAFRGSPVTVTACAAFANT